MVGQVREHGDWTLHESGAPAADHTVLLLPGGMCGAVFYDDVVAELADREGPSLRLVVATVPGHAGTPAPLDVTLENYGRTAGELARALGCDLVVGHSMGANVALEMVLGNEYTGPLVLLSPSFSRADESAFLGVLDKVARVLGSLPFRLMLLMTGVMMKGVAVPDTRRAELLADLRKNDPGFMRRAIRAYYEYLDRHAPLASGLTASGVRVWVVFGDSDDVGLSDDERATLEDAERVTLVVIPEAGHLTLCEQPGRVADIVVEALPRDADATTT